MKNKKIKRLDFSDIDEFFIRCCCTSSREESYPPAIFDFSHLSFINTSKALQSYL